MSDAMVDESGAGASVTGSASMSGATNTGSEATVLADIDTGEAFKQSVYNNSQAYAFNLKELTEKWSNLSIEQHRAWASLQLDAARRNQTMWESQQAEQVKDLAEIRARRMNQFDVAVRDHWNKEEELQDDIATNVTLQRIIDALKSAQSKA